VFWLIQPYSGSYYEMIYMIWWNWVDTRWQ